MTDIIDRINQLIAEPAASCWRCRRPILDATEDGFCSEYCQARWHAAGARQTEPVDGTTEAQIAAFESALAAIGHRKAASSPRRSWPCEDRGHLWQIGTRVTRCAACGHPVLPWHKRAHTRLLTRWNWWRGNVWRIARTIRRRLIR